MDTYHLINDLFEVLIRSGYSKEQSIEYLACQFTATTVRKALVYIRKQRSSTGAAKN